MSGMIPTPPAIFRSCSGGSTPVMIPTPPTAQRHSIAGIPSGTSALLTASIAPTTVQRRYSTPCLQMTTPIPHATTASPTPSYISSGVSTPVVRVWPTQPYAPQVIHLTPSVTPVPSATTSKTVPDSQQLPLCEESKATQDPALQSVRSLGLSQRSGSVGAKGVRGCAHCTLCHALLQAFAGKIRIESSSTSSALPAPPQELVDRVLASDLTEDDEALALSTLCRYHTLHKRRYDLWLRGQEAIKLCTSRGDVQATIVVRQTADELAKIEANAEKVESDYLESFSTFLKQLQKDVRENLFETLMIKADEVVAAWQSELDETDAQINRKIKQRQLAMKQALQRCQGTTREDLWKRKEKQSVQRFVSCLVDNCRNLQTCKSNAASQAFRDLALTEQGRRYVTEKEVEMKVSEKTEREYAKRDREMALWLGRMDQLQTLQHLQATKDREQVYSKVGMTIRRLEEDQSIEHKQVTARIQKHVIRMQGLLEKILRANGLTAKGMNCHSTTHITYLQPERFLQLVLRCELNPDGNFNDSAAGLTSCSSVPAIQVLDPSGTGTFSNAGMDNGLSMELQSFAEFLGVRFPSLREALSAMDLTGTGRLACFELESWLTQNLYPGDARMLLKDLGRRGHISLMNLRPLASPFIQSSLEEGRPGGTRAASLIKGLWTSFDRKSRRLHPFDAYRSILRCVRQIVAFESDSNESFLSVHDLHSLHERSQWPEVDYSPKRSKGGASSSSMNSSRVVAADLSLAEIGARSKNHFWGSAEARLSTMHFRNGCNTTPRALTQRAFNSPRTRPSGLGTSTALAMRDGVRRAAPPPNCIQAIRDQERLRSVSSPKKRAPSSQKSRSVSPRSRRQPCILRPQHSQDTKAWHQTAQGVSVDVTANSVILSKVSSLSQLETMKLNHGQKLSYQGSASTIASYSIPNNSLQETSTVRSLPMNHPAILRSPSVPILLGCHNPNIIVAGARTPMSARDDVKSSTHPVVLRQTSVPDLKSHLDASFRWDGSVTPKASVQRMLFPTALTPTASMVPHADWASVQALKEASTPRGSSLNLQPQIVHLQTVPILPIPGPKAALTPSTSAPSPRFPWTIAGSTPHSAYSPSSTGTPVISHAVAALTAFPRA